ncbi:hypothetical protein [Bacillus sp. FJAT-22090]|uniref:hypothetical protein n=1 Tax=Bacillus sp. FJAT-22090 TaxID=1581038 RepID=UPI00164308F3|nr:hypothetical protein [Bacillus sp. FJAT-22090]
MRKHIVEYTGKQCKTTEIKWNSSKHYNMTHLYNTVDEALDYIDDIEEIVSRFNHLS